MTTPNPSVRRSPAVRRAFALLVAAAALWSGPALAQGSDTNALLNRLSRLENEVRTLSQQVYRGGGPQSGMSGMSGAPLASSVATDLEVRLTRLEDELRRLTGKYEETHYGLTQLKDRLEKIQGDNDFRFQQLESKAGGMPPAGDAAPPARSNGPQKTGAALTPPATDGTLGTMPPGGGPQGGDARPQGGLTPPGPGASAQEEYDYAFGLLRNADYGKAEQALAGFVAKYPNNGLAGNAQYWLGETFYARQKYKEAAVAFAEGYQKYPKSSKAADNLLKLAMSLDQLKQNKDACLALQQLATQFPDSSATVKRRAEQQGKKLGCK